jgi:Flp pilus assembly protein TadG
MRRSNRDRGHSVVEAALIAPWFFLLFAGVLDYGFYAYALISTENAARVAAFHAASSQEFAADHAAACALALKELRALPNVGDNVNACGELPVVVTAQSVTGPDGAPAARVSVTYESLQLFPIPGLRGKLTVTRISEARVGSE